VDLDNSPDSESRGPSVLSSEFNFGDDVFDVDRNVRSSQSRREKREDRYQWACLKRLQDDIPIVNFTKQELRGLQDKVSKSEGEVP